MSSNRNHLKLEFELEQGIEPQSRWRLWPAPLPPFFFFATLNFSTSVKDVQGSVLCWSLRELVRFWSFPFSIIATMRMATLDERAFKSPTVKWGYEVELYNRDITMLCFFLFLKPVALNHSNRFFIPIAKLLFLLFQPVENLPQVF